MKVYSIIPARGGSKGVPGKNIKCLGGYPLIAYAIAASKMAGSIERTIVSTDSREIADIAVAFGAEAPFLRPAEISLDNSTDLELFQHAIAWFEQNGVALPDLIVHLRPTTPLRDPAEIGKAIAVIAQRPDATCLRSAYVNSQPPQKMFMIDDKNFFRGFFPNDPRPDYHNLPRQSFPKAYCPNGYVDVVRPEFIKKTNTLHGPNILAYITPSVGEVDKADDFDFLEYLLSRNGSVINKYLTEHYPKYCPAGDQK